MKKAVIGTVRPDMIDGHFTDCLVRTLTEDYDGRLVSRMPFISSRAPAGMIHVARNAVVQQFLTHPMGPDYLVFIDTDMSWTPQDVWDLLDEARHRDLPILGGLAVMQGGSNLDEMKPVMFENDFKPIRPTGEVQLVFCGGSAFLALRRDALKACADAYSWPTPWFDYGTRNGKAVTEDVIFAQRMWEMGIPFHVHSGITVGHRKIHTYIAPSPVVEAV